MMGELFLKHKEQLDKLPLMAQKEEEVVRLEESSQKEVTGINELGCLFYGF
jgi:hypothetical protein